MQIDSNQYLDECNNYLKNRQFSEAEKCLDKAFYMDSCDDSLNIRKLFTLEIFSEDNYFAVQNELIDDYVYKTIEIIEMYIESANLSFSKDIQEKLSKLLTNLKLLIKLCRNDKQLSSVYKNMFDIYILFNDDLNAFKSIKNALYFNKSKSIKSSYLKLAKDYGKQYKMDDDIFRYKLLSNIYFKSVQNEVNDDVLSNKKYLVNGENLHVEDVAINYYNKKGLNAFHCENYFWSFNAQVFFRDINKDYPFNPKSNKIFVENLYNRCDESRKINFKEFLKKYYYLNKFEGYFTDYVEFDGYDEWVKRLNAIGIDKCMKLLVERELHIIGSRLPLSGLPDLFVYKDKQCFFAEVKSTNDTLSFEQKWWHMYISDELNIPIVIFMVNKSESQIKSMKRQYFV